MGGHLGGGGICVCFREMCGVRLRFCEWLGVYWVCYYDGQQKCSLIGISYGAMLRGIGSEGVMSFRSVAERI